MFERRLRDERLTVALNLGPEPRTLPLTRPHRALLSTAGVSAGPQDAWTLAPGEGLILEPLG